jgi:hypothetical protein
MRKPQLLRARHAATRRLLPIAQGRIEKNEPAVHKNRALTR